MSDCDHDWCDSAYVLTSNPPQRDRICRKCGRAERVATGPYYDAGEFDRLKRQFGGGKVEIRVPKEEF